MFAIGGAILARLTILGREPATGKLPLDLLFAAFFLLRGFMHLRAVRRAP